MSPSRRVWTRRIASCLLFSSATTAVPPAAAQIRTYTETVEVREAEILVEMPSGLHRKELRRLRPTDLSVLVEGNRRSATKIEPPAAGQPEATPGAILIYVDETMAEASTIALGVLALARRAERLTGLGAVEIAVADPAPRLLLEPTEAPRAVEQVLAEIAAEARRREGSPAGEWDRGPDRGGDSLAPVARWAHLRRWAAVRGAEARSPRILFLVANAELPSAETVEAVLAEGEPAAAPSEGAGSPEEYAAAVAEAARELAGDGWAVVGLTLRRGELERAAPAPAEIRYPDGSSRPFLDIFGILARLFSKRLRHKQIVDPRAFEAQTDPRLAPLRRLARDTAGMVVRYEELLDPVLDRLAGRWRLWFEAPAVDGASLATLEVRLPGRGIALRAPRWVRLADAATPDRGAEEP